jgi:hypothetical protein
VHILASDLPFTRRLAIVKELHSSIPGTEEELQGWLNEHSEINEELKLYVLNLRPENHGNYAWIDDLLTLRHMLDA